MKPPPPGFAKALLTIVVVPLIPVVVLYLLFDRLNFFFLQDPSRTMVIFGPIGAYLVIMHLAFRYYLILSAKSGPDGSRVPKELLGVWTFKSTTNTSGKVATGDLNTTIKDGQLHLSVVLKGESDEPFAVATSDFCLYHENRLQFIYQIRGFDSDLKEAFLAECTCNAVRANDAPLTLRGPWQRIGDGHEAGKVTMIKR